MLRWDSNPQSQQVSGRRPTPGRRDWPSRSCHWDITNTQPLKCVWILIHQNSVFISYFLDKRHIPSPISLFCYYTNTPVLSDKKPGLMSLGEFWETCVLNTETTECLTTATGVNISSKFIPCTQAAFTVVAFRYETNYDGVLNICYAVVYRGGSARKSVGAIGN
jgi:hypothetical protein